MTSYMQESSSYFPPPQQYGYYATPSGEFRAQNIDDIVYRYSSELDRGTPRVGIYAQDGLWDDDISEAHTVRPSSSSTSTVNTRKSLKDSSSKGRSRSGTMTSIIPEEPRPGMWSWGRKSHAPIPQDLDHALQPAAEVVEGKTKVLRKEKSRGKLRGMGRRGELSLKLRDGDDSFEAPPPLPLTPASFATASSPAGSTSTFMSPQAFPTRTRLHSGPEILSNPGGVPAKAKSSWKRGMEKLFKSKSSTALRDAFHKENIDRPPMPHDLSNLPKYTNNPLGKPFSASTPPMPLGVSRRMNTNSVHLSTPPSATSESFGSISRPVLPHDPFASSLDLSSNNLPRSPSSLASPRLESPNAPSRPRLSKNSPSLRDLKAFFPAKPKLSKAKSLANLKAEDTMPRSAPPTQTEFFPPTRMAKRMSSLMGLSRLIDRHQPSPVEEELTIPAYPSNATNAPAESPPLLPPNPPYFPASASMSNRLSDSSSSSNLSSALPTPGFMVDVNGHAWTPPPSSPLPEPPSSGSSTQLATKGLLSRSGSGAVLLPRSRSTSMSLRAPPTSSSFFDLYEQLGIWPTPDKDKENVGPKNENPDHGSVAASPSLMTSTLLPPPMSESPSVTFSTSSWEAHINAFPLIDDPIPSGLGDTSFDYGLPDMESENEVVELAGNSLADEGVSDVLSNIAVASSSRSTTRVRVSADSSASSAPTAQPISSTARGRGSAGSLGLSRGHSGSAGSSRDGSQERQPRGEARRTKESRPHVGLQSDSSDSDSDPDDVPLSKLHPDAAAAQQLHREAAHRRRAERRIAKQKIRSMGVGIRQQGRNPGGGTSWDGEGGIPAEVLRSRLERLILSATSAAEQSSLASRSQHAESSLRGQRSLTNPHTDSHLDASSDSMQRAQTLGHHKPAQWQSGRPLSPNTMPAASVMPHQRQVSPTTQYFAHQQQTRPVPSRQGSAAGTSSSPRQREKSGDVARSDTTATQRAQSSQTSRQRSRALSNAAPPVQSENLHLRSVTEPLPQSKVATQVSVYVGGTDGRRISVDLYPQTTAKDVLSTAYSRGDLGETSQGMHWVVVEVFAELGCERKVREYESLLTIVKGWDQTVKYNCFVLRPSTQANLTWARAVPSTPPMLGSFDHFESKKGKWGKRWLETRGGQVFLAKNEKNKDEVQINTSFFDIYTVSKPYGAPKPFVFILKRSEPAASFENPDDYMYTFSAEEGIAFKLAAAIYDAKSFTLSNTSAHLLRAASTDTGVQRRATVKGEKPLVDLQREEGERSAFTGKGLLKV